jgi:hypothetical protein
MASAFSTVASYSQPVPSTLDTVPIPLSADPNGVPVVVPAFSGQTGALAPGAVNLAAAPALANVPVQVALLVELRVMNVLLNEQYARYDLQQMRADELANVLPATALM